MHIGLDAFSALGKGGNSMYSRELIRHLLVEKRSHHFYLFGYLHDLFRPQFREQGASQHTEVHTRLSPSYFPLPRLTTINEILLRAAARLRGIEVFHFTNPMNIVSGPWKRVVTVHDLAPFHDPSWAKEDATTLIKQKMSRIVSSDAIIAVSEFTKQDLVEKWGVDPQKVTVVHEAVGGEFFPDDDRAFTHTIVGADSYLLCVGQLQPRKNNINLIRAFSTIAPQFPGLKLVFVGRPVSKEYFQSLQTAIRDAGVEDRVVFNHTVDTTGLRKLYTRAACLVYPSLFEGFGLPILEAYQCGTPAITSSTSSLPEVAGEASILVNPNSSEEIADAIQRLLSDSTLRETLRAAIPAQLKKFSWEKAARETLDVYESLA